MWSAALLLMVAGLSVAPPATNSPTTAPTAVPTTAVPGNATNATTDIPLVVINNETDIPSVGQSTLIPTSIPTSIPTLVPDDVEADYLGVVLGLPTSPDELLDGFPMKAAQKLSEITSVDESAITEGSNSTTVPYNIELKIHAPVATYRVMKQKVSLSVSNGMFIAGVRVQRVEYRIRATEASDECEASPCGSNQLCVDNNFDAKGDFVCSCLDGSHQKIGLRTPSCNPPLNDISDVSEILEVIALANGHTVFAASYNSLLHSTQCGSSTDDPPLVFHPTRLSVGGSMMAGAIVSNTSLVLGCILLQHLFIIILAHYFPDKSMTELKCITGFPHVCIRVMLSLLPGTVYCSVSLISSNEGQWAVALGCIIITVWLLWLVLMASHGRDVQPYHLLALGQHYPHSMGFKRLVVFNNSYSPWYIGFLILLCVIVPFKVVGVSGCSAQRYLSGIALLLLLVLTIRLQPFSLKYCNVLCCVVIVIQAVSWNLLGSGLDKADGHRDHPHIDGSIYLRLISAIIIIIWMIVSFLYRIPNEYGLSTSKVITSNPTTGLKQLWSNLSFFGKISFTSGDLCWLCVCLGIYDYYFFIPAALFLILRVAYLLKGSSMSKSPLVESLEDALIQPEEVETFVVVKDGEPVHHELHLSPSPKHYSPPEMVNPSSKTFQKQSYSITARSPSSDHSEVDYTTADLKTESLEAQRFPLHSSIPESTDHYGKVHTPKGVEGDQLIRCQVHFAQIEWLVIDHLSRLIIIAADAEDVISGRTQPWIKSPAQRLKRAIEMADGSAQCTNEVLDAVRNIHPVEGIGENTDAILARINRTPPRKSRPGILSDPEPWSSSSNPLYRGVREPFTPTSPSKLMFIPSSGGFSPSTSSPLFGSSNGVRFEGCVKRALDQSNAHLSSHTTPKTRITPRRDVSPGEIQTSIKIRPSKTRVTFSIQGDGSRSVSSMIESTEDNSSLKVVSVLDGSTVLSFPMSVVDRCGAEPAHHPNAGSAFFIVIVDPPASPIRYTFVCDTVSQRDDWVSWAHSVCPWSCVVLPSTLAAN